MMAFSTHMMAFSTHMMAFAMSMTALATPGIAPAPVGTVCSTFCDSFVEILFVKNK
jgi:hypothetical protein